MSKEPMKDVIVLLPGITGSVLTKDGKEVWGMSPGALFKGLLTGGGSMRKALTLQGDDPAVDDLGDGVKASALMPDLHLLPGIWKIDGYAKCADTIKSRFEVVEGKNFFGFPYDWRRDNRVAARWLQRASHKWLTDWRQSSGNADARLILIAHSMGGLVSRYFLECMEGWKSTRMLITFGTPYRGSLNAVDSLVNGVHKGPMDLTDFARSLTGLYQLLPAFHCYDGGDGKLALVGESTGIPHIDPARAAAALQFHREIEKAVQTNQQDSQYGYDIRLVIGIKQDTKLGFRPSGTTVEFSPTLKDAPEGGDGTVPRGSAVPFEMDDDRAAMFAATQHGSLQNTDAVLNHIEGVLTGVKSLGGFRAVRPQVALEVEDLYLPDEQIEIHARPTSAVPLTAVLWRERDGDPIAREPMKASADGWNHVAFPPMTSGSYRVTVEGPNVESAEDAFAILEPGA